MKGMTMDARCPRCGRTYDIEPDEVGRMARCEVCGNRFVIDARRFRRYIVSLFSNSGRIWRREYLKALAVVAVPAAVMVVVGVIVDPAEVDMALMWYWLLPTVTFCILAAPASIRRLHDIGLSGRWYYIVVVLAVLPGLGAIGCLRLSSILSCIPGTRGSNKYDDGTTPWRKFRELREAWLSACKGRLSRTDFWIIQVICCVSWLLIDCIFSSKLVTSISSFAAAAVRGFAGVVLVYFALLARIQRAHDLNRSGWWLLFYEGTVACWILGKGLFEDIMFFLVLAWLIILGSFDGTPGDNDYGNDPKGRVGTGERKDTSKRAFWILTAVSVIIAITTITVKSPSTDEQVIAGANKSTPVFSEVRDLKDVVTRECDEISNDCLYRHSGWGLKIEQVIDGKGVLVEHKDWREHGQDIFIKMNTDDLVDGDPLPPVTVKYIGIYRYQTVSGAERSVRAFKVVKKYKISSE